MLNPIEKLKVAILHLNKDWNHCIVINVKCCIYLYCDGNGLYGNNSH